MTVTVFYMLVYTCSDSSMSLIGDVDKCDTRYDTWHLTWAIHLAARRCHINQHDAQWSGHDMSSETVRKGQSSNTSPQHHRFIHGSSTALSSRITKYHGQTPAHQWRHKPGFRQYSVSSRVTDKTDINDEHFHIVTNGNIFGQTHDSWSLFPHDRVIGVTLTLHALHTVLLSTPAFDIVTLIKRISLMWQLTIYTILLD